MVKPFSSTHLLKMVKPFFKLASLEMDFWFSSLLEMVKPFSSSHLLRWIYIVFKSLRDGEAFLKLISLRDGKAFFKLASLRDCEIIFKLASLQIDIHSF